MEILGTEGVANKQGGRKPGGVVNGSVCKVKKAETGLMYMSVSRPRVSQGPMSSPRVERSKGMLQLASVEFQSVYSRTLSWDPSLHKKSISDVKIYFSKLATQSKTR